MQNEGTLRHYFCMIARVTLTNAVYDHVNDHNNHHTVVVVESGFFGGFKEEQQDFKRAMEDFGVPSKHVLFGEDYASGYHYIILKIHELCK